MKIEIDQSGRVADTSIPTVIAFSNGIVSSIYVSSEIKRRAVIQLRPYHSPRRLYIHLYCLFIFLLLKRHLDRIQSIYIDQEYIGREDEIKEYFIEYLHRNKLQFDFKRIHFVFIGKQSAAHTYALDCFRKKKGDKTLTLEEIVYSY